MIEKTAHGCGRNDETPNIELAVDLIATMNEKGIEEIVNGLQHPVTVMANDCIKVLYEIGERSPELIASYADVFIELLQSKNNRLVWGAMTALSTIASNTPYKILEHLDTVINAYENGSVITIDTSISVLAQLMKSVPSSEKRILPVLINHFETCRPKSVAQHAERAFVGITKNNRDIFKTILVRRRGDLTDSQKKRIDILLKKMDEIV